MQRLYLHSEPRAALLNRYREVIQPTLPELTGVLGLRDGMSGRTPYYALENLEGIIRGYGALRMAGQAEQFYGELVLLGHEDEPVDSPLMHEAFEWLRDRAFQTLMLRKVITHCLSSETEAKAWFLQQGYVHEGTMREVLFSRGRWYDSVSLTLYNPMFYPAGVPAA